MAVAMKDNPFNTTEGETTDQPLFNAGAPGQPPPQQPPPQQKQPSSEGPSINWQPAAANFVSDQAWQQYGGVPHIEKEVDIPQKLQWAIRAFHILTAFFIGLASVLAFITGDNSFRSFVVCVYLWFFGCVLCMFETPLKIINKIVEGNCGFMEHSAGRFFFLLLIGSLAMGFGTWGIVGGSFAFAAAILNVYAAVVYQTCCKDFVDSEAVGGMEWRGTDGKSASNPMTNDPPAYRAEQWAAETQPPPAGSFPAGGDDV